MKLTLTPRTKWGVFFGYVYIYIYTAKKQLRSWTLASNQFDWWGDCKNDSVEKIPGSIRPYLLVWLLYIRI